MRLSSIVVAGILALSATSAMAGQIIVRGPTTGVLVAAINHPAEPPATSLGVLYKGISAGRGSLVTISPEGRKAGDKFAVVDPLPAGLVLDPATGRIVGAAMASASVSIRVQRGGVYEVVTFSISVA